MLRNAAVRSTPATRSVARVCALSVFVGAAISALGWVAHLPWLTDWDNDGINTKFNSALCLLILSLGVMLSEYRPRYRYAVRVLGGIVVLIAGATLVETIFGLNFGIDTLIFTEPQGTAATASPGRMGFTASASFLLLGSALLLGTISKARPAAAILIVITILIASMPLVGYMYGAEELFAMPLLTGIALQTAMMIAVLAFGAAASIPEYGIAEPILRDDSAGLMLRRTLPVLLLVVIFFGRLIRFGIDGGYYNAPVGGSMRVLFEIIMLTCLLLWVARHVTAAEKASIEAINANARNKMYERIAQTQEKERKRLAHDLHDEVGQEVTGLRFALERLCDEKKMGPETIKEIKTVCKQLEKLDSDVSNLAWRMRPPVLDSDGMVAGLQRLGAECSRIHGIEFDFHASSRLPVLPADVETNIYRIAQEAMNNVVKHAEASRIGLTLDCVDGEVRLAIEDDGHGFTQSADAIHQTDGGGFGLMGMRERAAIVGGSLEIESEPGQGTTLLLRIPMNCERVGDDSFSDKSAGELAVENLG